MANTSTDFIGIGWAFPPDVSPSGGIAMVARAREIEQAIQIVMLTYPGERPMRPRFGCRLRDYVFRPADYQTAIQLSIEVKSAVEMWEPRVNVVNVDVRPSPVERNRLDIDVIYQIKGTNDRRNLVHPFYTIPDDGSDY